MCDVMKWTRVEDGLPEEKLNKNRHDFEYVLCATTFGDVRPFTFGKAICGKKPHFWWGGEMVDRYVTHWMYLPKMP